MKPPVRARNLSFWKRATAVLIGLFGGGCAGGWAGILLLVGVLMLDSGQKGPGAEFGFGIAVLIVGMIGALLGGLCGAAVGFRWTTDPVRSPAAWMLALSVTAAILCLATGLLFWAESLRQRAQVLRVHDDPGRYYSEQRDQKDAELIDDWVAGRTLELDGTSAEDRLRFINSESVWAEKFPQIDDDKLLPLIELIDRQNRPMATQALVVELQNPQRSEEIRIACLKALLTMPTYQRQMRWRALEQLGPEGAFLMPALAESLGEEMESNYTWYQQFFDSDLLTTLERLGPTAAPVVPVLEAAIKDIKQKSPSFRDKISAGERTLRAMRVRQPN